MLYLVYGQRPHDLPVVGGLFPTVTPTFFSVTSTNTPTATSFIDASDVTPLYVLPAFILTQNAISSAVPSFVPTQTPAINSYGLPSGFPFITDRGDFYTRLNRVLFSYYYPDLGGVNCHEDNWSNGHCADVTASKVVGWREYMGKGIAIHSDLYDEIPYGSQIYVVSPPQIAGIYTVVDLCCGCKNQNGYYFDFLFEGMPDGLGWSYNVDFVVTRYGWDVQLMDVPVPNCGLYYPDNTSTPEPTISPTYTSEPVFSATPYPTYTAYPTYTPDFIVPTIIPNTPTLSVTGTVSP